MFSHVVTEAELSEGRRVFRVCRMVEGTGEHLQVDAVDDEDETWWVARGGFACDLVLLSQMEDVILGSVEELVARCLVSVFTQISSERTVEAAASHLVWHDVDPKLGQVELEMIQHWQLVHAD